MKKFGCLVAIALMLCIISGCTGVDETDNTSELKQSVADEINAFRDYAQSIKDILTTYAIQDNRESILTIPVSSSLSTLTDSSDIVANSYGSIEDYGVLSTDCSYDFTNSTYYCLMTLASSDTTKTFTVVYVFDKDYVLQSITRSPLVKEDIQMGTVVTAASTSMFIYTSVEDEFEYTFTSSVVTTTHLPPVSSDLSTSLDEEPTEDTETGDIQSDGNLAESTRKPESTLDDISEVVEPIEASEQEGTTNEG